MDDDILTFIFNARVEELSLLTEKDKNYLAKFCFTDKAYNNLERLINQNCADNFTDIISSVDKFVDDFYFESGFFKNRIFIIRMSSLRSPFSYKFLSSHVRLGHTHRHQNKSTPSPTRNDVLSCYLKL